MYSDILNLTKILCETQAQEAKRLFSQDFLLTILTDFLVSKYIKDNQYFKSSYFTQKIGSDIVEKTIFYLLFY
jgi:hypothetical protein